MQPAEQALNTKQQLADEAFENYDFCGATVEEHDSWDTNDSNDFIKVAYVTYPEHGPEEDSYKVSFHVTFNADDTLKEVYALEVDSGNEIGQPGKSRSIGSPK